MFQVKPKEQIGLLLWQGKVAIFAQKRHDEVDKDARDHGQDEAIAISVLPKGRECL